MLSKSILLACAAALTLAHSGSVFAASLSDCTAAAEMQRAIEADFHVCVLKGLVEGWDQATAEDQCAIKYIAAIEPGQIADDDDEALAAEFGDLWWVEY